jgi:hypothetical protein
MRVEFRELWVIFQEKLTLKKIFKNIYLYIILKSNIIYITMSEWLNFVKAYAEKNNVSYKQALRDASPSYKTRNEKKPEEPTEKTKRKYNKKVVENITLKL